MLALVDKVTLFRGIVAVMHLPHSSGYDVIQELNQSGKICLLDLLDWVVAARNSRYISFKSHPIILQNKSYIR